MKGSKGEEQHHMNSSMLEGGREGRENGREAFSLFLVSLNLLGVGMRKKKDGYRNNRGGAIS